MTYKVLQNRPFRGRTFFEGQRITVAEMPAGDDEIPAAFVEPMTEAGLIAPAPKKDSNPKPDKGEGGADVAEPA